MEDASGEPGNCQQQAGNESRKRQKRDGPRLKKLERIAFEILMKFTFAVIAMLLLLPLGCNSNSGYFVVSRASSTRNYGGVEKDIILYTLKHHDNIIKAHCQSFDVQNSCSRLNVGDAYNFTQDDQFISGITVVPGLKTVLGIDEEHQAESPPPMWLTFLTGGIGGLIITFLKDWFLQRSRTKGQTLADKEIHVTKAYFDTEFSAIKDVFTCISDTRLALNAMRPETGYPSGQDNKDLAVANLAELKKTYNNLLTTTEHQSAFYPIDLYEAAKKCQRAAFVEIEELEHPAYSAFSAKWYEQGRVNQQEYRTHYEEVRKLIQKRLSQLTILPS